MIIFIQSENMGMWKFNIWWLQKKASMFSYSKSSAQRWLRSAVFCVQNQMVLIWLSENARLIIKICCKSTKSKNKHTCRHQMIPIMRKIIKKGGKGTKRFARILDVNEIEIENVTHNYAPVIVNLNRCITCHLHYSLFKTI